MRAKTRKWAVGMLALALVPFVSGCWDRREINDMAFVTACAADRTEDGKYRVTVEVPLPGKISSVGNLGGGGGSSGTKAYFIDSTVGDTFRQANADQQKAMSRQLYFAHMRVFVFGEELARDNIAQAIDVMARLPQNRMTTYLVVSEGPGADVLNTESSMEKTPAEFLRELASQFERHPRTVKRVTEALLAEGQDPYMPLVSVIETTPGDEARRQTYVKVTGLAIFRGPQMVGMLKGPEADGVLWALGEIKRPTVTVPAPHGAGHISVIVTRYRTRVAMHRDGEGVSCRITVKAMGTLAENTSPYMYEITKNLPRLEHEASLEIAGEIASGMKALKSMRADPVGLCNRVYRLYPALWHEKKQNWRESLYAHIPVEVHVELDLRNSGNATSPVAIPEEDLKA
ncbi:Ger(x)C family spore germination protein [Alicyclobacillus mali (ex Roth et al. 2021)]|uniref:Ger(x)C family spore germination protein n=1 Tax=Alicyclobacillus mali (ex Roth et al. 2021) TaxID=1123961 RepID=UPI001A8D0EAA|nr:Ger(x)C family spore germination protein [Alicyclobacillus mali (ex Roth et al. 2021)]